MAKRLLSYPHGAETEIEQLCERLSQANVSFYETPGSRWGFSSPTIWIREEEDFPRAKEILQQHAEAYAAQARAEYQQQTGYDPNADWRKQTSFLLRHWWQRKIVLLAVLIGFALIAWYFSLFFALFI